MEYIVNLISSGEYEKIEGWCTPSKALKISEIIIKNNCKTCLELGVFGGRSLLPIAIAAGQNSNVIGIDAWTADASLEGTNDQANSDWWKNIDYNNMYKYTCELMETHKINVKLIKDKSKNCAHMFLENSIDLLHQDSNHSEEISCEEVDLYWNKVTLGKFWVFDDTNWSTTVKAQNKLLEKGYKEIFDGNTWKIFQRL